LASLPAADKRIPVHFYIPIMAYETSNRFSTKISPPVKRPLLVKRSRLVEFLRLGMKRKLSLVIAPAGFGKTTLLGEWQATISKEAWPVVWITLDQDDNDPLLFWGYVLDALLTINPDWQFDQPKIDPTTGGIDHQFLASVTNQIAASPDSFSLILDDYHAIQVDLIHKDLLYFINHMPVQMHVVVSSRVKPQFPVSELRVRDQLIEIGTPDMSFSAGECEIFLNKEKGLDLSSNEVDLLASITEGWAAGLQMAALSIKNQPDAAQWIHGLNGSQGFIFDYLTEAVLDVQDETIQDFLLKTSILNEISAPLCDYMLENHDSQARLDYLENTNLFISPLNENRLWYRYHALFADILKIRLERKYPSEIPNLHLRAATWLNKNNFPERAIPHAFAAGYPEMAADIIEGCALQALGRLEVITFRKWIRLLPDTLLVRRPSLWIYSAMAENALGNLDEAETTLRKIKNRLEDANRDGLEDTDLALLFQQITALQAVVDLQTDKYPKGITLAMQAMVDLPESDSLLYGWLNHFLGYAYEMAGDLESAVKSFTLGAENSLKHKIPAGILSRCEIGRIRKMQGRLRDAEREYRRALEFAAETSMEREMVILAQLGLGDVLMEQDNPKIVEQWAKQIEIFLPEANIGQFGYLFAVSLYTYLANYYLERDISKAKLYLQKARSELKKTKPLFYLSLLTDLRIKIWLAEEDTAFALRWAEKKTAVMESGGMLTSSDKIGLARIYLDQSKAEAAYPLLDQVEAEARVLGIMEKLIETLILRARALHILNQEEKSLQTLTQALKLAEPEGYVRIFVSERKQIHYLLSKLLTAFTRRPVQTSIMPSKAYIERLLSAFDHTTQPANVTDNRGGNAPSTTTSMLEPLSQRELVVLALLKDGKPGSEIARLLVISNNTVKVHIRNIYQKLDAHNRKEALERASEYHLLD